MKKIFLLLLLPLLAMALYSCSMEEGAKSGGDGNTKLVKTVRIQEFYDGKPIRDGAYWTSELFYDDQRRLTRIREGYGENGRPYIGDGEDYIPAIIYGSNSIIIGWTNYYTDNNGYVTKIEQEGEFTRYVLIEYSNGYMAKATYSFSNRWSTRSGVNSYTWENGNCTKMNFYSEHNDPPYYGIINNYGLTLTYGNVVNKMNVELWYIGNNGGIADYGLEQYNFGFFTNFGLKGMKSKNLPISVAYNDDPDHETFSYTFDSEGYPIQIITNYNDSYDPGRYLRFTITYY